MRCERATWRLATIVAFTLSLITFVATTARAQTHAGPVVAASAPAYHGYTVIGCLAAAQRIEGAFFRALDTVRDKHYPPEVPEVRDSAQRCLRLGGWTAASVEPRTLPIFYHLAVLADDSTASVQAIARMLGRAKSASDTLAILSDAAIAVDGPFRLVWPPLNVVIRTLHAMSNPNAAAALGHVYAFIALTGLGTGLFDDTTGLRYVDSLTATAARTSRDSAAQLQVAISVLRGQIQLMNGDTVLRNGTRVMVPPLSGSVILGPPGPYPVPHKIALIVFLPPGNEFEALPTVERLKAKFGDTMQVVVVANTRGYYRLRAPLDPSAEAQLLQHYFSDSLKVKVPVVLEETPLSHRPAPDGRAVYGLTASQQAYPNLAYLLVDGNGVARSGGMQWWISSEVHLVRRIQRLIAETSSRPAAP